MFNIKLYMNPRDHPPAVGFPPRAQGTWGTPKIPICGMVHPMYPGLINWDKYKEESVEFGSSA
jgi:hypothetical protein